MHLESYIPIMHKSKMMMMMMMMIQINNKSNWKMQNSLQISLQNLTLHVMTHFLNLWKANNLRI